MRLQDESSIYEASVRAVRLADGGLVDIWARHADDAVALKTRVVHLLGYDERTTLDAARRVLSHEESLLEEIAWLCDAMFMIRRGLPILRPQNLARQLARIVSPDALLLFHAGLELHPDDRFDWDCVPLPDGGRTDRLLRDLSVDTHIHLGGTLPPAFYWIPLMGGGLQLDLLRGLPSSERGHGDPSAWRRGVGRAIWTRLKLALELEKSSVDQRGRRLFPWLTGDWRSWLEDHLPQEPTDAEPDDLRETAFELEDRFCTRQEGSHGFDFPDAIRPPCNPADPRHFAVGERRLLYLAALELRRRTDRELLEAELLADRIRDYLMVRNAFHRLLVHDRGTEGLLRFVQSFRRRGVLGRRKARRSSPQSKHRRRRARRQRRHTRMVAQIEAARMFYGLESQLVEPYTTDDAALEAPPTRGASGRPLGLKSGPNRNIELRVSVPRTQELIPTFRAWVRGIIGHLKERDRSSNRQIGLVFHLIKKGSREEDEQEALDAAERLDWMLCEEPWLRPLVVGVDAAGQERDANPRVFLTAFHHLQHRMTTFRPRSGEPPIHLGFTFHVGEDVDDLLTGLRHIDEAVSLLLPAEDGGRLGHALALGEDVDRFYDRRRATEPRLGSHLLDLVWAWGRATDAGEREHLRWLELRIERLARSTRERMVRCYDEMCLDQGPSGIELHSERHLLRFLTQGSSSDPESLERGIPVPLDTPEWRSLVRSMQTLMQERIAHRKICVEANPTSNLLIGDYASYRELPYSQLVDAGIALSLNTDDPGLFMTTLPGELAAMYDALHRSGMKHRDILAWLRERIFDGEQSTFLDPFISTDEVAARLESAWELEPEPRLLGG